MNSESRTALTRAVLSVGEAHASTVESVYNLGYRDGVNEAYLASKADRDLRDTECDSREPVRSGKRTSEAIGSVCIVAALVIFAAVIVTHLWGKPIRAAIVALLAALGISGCSTLQISTTERAPGWPDLDPVVIEIPAKVLSQVCSKLGSAMQTHEACNIPMFALRTCLVFVDPMTMNGTVPGDNATRLQHEKDGHCKGYEHVGGRGNAELLAAFNLWSEYVEWRAAQCAGRARGNEPANIVRAYGEWAQFKSCGVNRGFPN